MSFGREKYRHKEECGGEQDDCGTGRQIPRGRNQHYTHRSCDCDQPQIPAQRRETIRQLYAVEAGIRIEAGSAGRILATQSRHRQSLSRTPMHGSSAAGSAAPIQLEEHLYAEQKSKRGRIPVVIPHAVDRSVPVIPLVGHFPVQGELLCEHIISSPAEPPGKRVAG